MAAKNRLITIVGPTASGKTALAIELAQKFNGEIICADSRTVYKGLDIGTAKPSSEEQAVVKHHLIDIIEPNEIFTAAQFQKLAGEVVKDIWQRGKQPILVGGTGLYVDGLLYSYKFGPLSNSFLRSLLEKRSIEELQKICKSRNIELPVNHKNKRHLIRAIEQNGINKKRSSKLYYNNFTIGLQVEREILKTRITKRAQQMFKLGVEKETTEISQKFGWEAPGLSGSIYPIIKRKLEGKLTLDQAIEEFIRSDMRLAKRQMTWFKRNSDIFWVDNKPDAITAVEKFLNT